MAGNLNDEETVLSWLVEQKNSDTIEELTDELLENIIHDNEYVVVYFSKTFLKKLKIRCRVGSFQLQIQVDLVMKDRNATSCLTIWRTLTMKLTRAVSS